MAFQDYNWEDEDTADVYQEKFNNAMALADGIPTVPLGGIVMWWGNPNDITLFDGDGNGVVDSTMAKYALCLGQALTGSLLKNYDGSARTTAPNMGGKFPVGWKVADADYNEVGKEGGEKTHTLIASEIPIHSHSYSDNTFGSDEAISNSGSGARASSANNYDQSRTTGPIGGGAAHENRPPFETVCFIIRYK